MQFAIRYEDDLSIARVRGYVSKQLLKQFLSHGRVRLSLRNTRSVVAGLLFESLPRRQYISVDGCPSDTQGVGPKIVENVFDENLVWSEVCLQLRQIYRIDSCLALQEFRGHSSFRLTDLIDNCGALGRIIGIQ